MNEKLLFRAWDEKLGMSGTFGIGGHPEWDGAIHTVPYWLSRCRVERFTGLTDKNGDMIFEGDVVDMNLDGRFPVLWDDVMTGFVCNVWCGSSFSNGKVIGSMHENPELLEERECATAQGE